MVAQKISLLRPGMVRQLVLAGTGPRDGGHQMHGSIYDIEHTARRRTTGIEKLLHIFFDVTETSRARGREYVQSPFSRTEGKDNTNVLPGRTGAVRRDRRMGQHPGFPAADLP
jgi:hypothetical protein